LARAKTLFKSLQPGAVLGHLLTDEISGAAPRTDAAPEHIRSLEQLLAILTDEDRLNAAGLTLDDRRVRRKTGTRDDLVSPLVLDGAVALLQALTNGVA